MRLTYILLLVSSLAFSESRVKVAIVDTGLRSDPYLMSFICKVQPVDVTNTGIYDNYGHGTNITGTVLQGLDPNKVCFIPIKFFNGPEDKGSVWLDALRAVKRLNVSYLNASLSGTGSIPGESELILGLLNDGVRIAVAAGNDGQNLDLNCNIFPGCLRIASPFFRVVGHTFKGIPVKTSNYGKVVTDWSEGYSSYGGIVMNGTSQATALLMNKWLKLKYKKK